MRNKNRSMLVIVVVLAALLLSACGSSPQVAYMTDSVAAYESYNGAGAMKTASMVNSAAVMDYDMEVAAASDADYGFGGSYRSYEEPEEAPEPKPESAGQDKINVDKIIYSSDVTVETTKFDESITKLEKMIDKYGAWVESSSVNGSDYYNTARGKVSERKATYNIRVPSSNFNDMMNGFTDVGNVPYKHIYTENVTSQYYDTQARMKSYQTQEDRLLEMVELAESVDDLITIESHLTDVRYMIESLQSNLNNWDRRVSYSSIKLQLNEVREYTPEQIVNPTFGEELARAVKNGFETAKNVIKGLMTGIAETLPTLCIIGVLVWLIVLLIKFIRKKTEASRMRRAEKRALKKAERIEKLRNKSASAAVKNAEESEESK